MVEHFVGHPATIVDKGDHTLPAAPFDADAHMPRFLNRVERIDQQVQHHLLDLLRIDHPHPGRPLVDLD